MLPRFLRYDPVVGRKFILEVSIESFHGYCIQFIYLNETSKERNHK